MTIMTCMTHDMYDFSLVFFVCHSSSRGILKSTSDYCFRLKHETGKITSQISCLDTLSCHSSKFFSILEHPPLVLLSRNRVCCVRWDNQAPFCRTGRKQGSFLTLVCLFNQLAGKFQTLLFRIVYLSGAFKHFSFQPLLEELTQIHLCFSYELTSPPGIYQLASTKTQRQRNEPAAKTWSIRRCFSRFSVYFLFGLFGTNRCGAIQPKQSAAQHVLCWRTERTERPLSHLAGNRFTI